MLREFNEKMSALADAIRSKSGKTGKMGIAAMKEAVDGISTGVNVQRKTGTFQSSGNSTTRLTIDCGFTPDVVLISPPGSYSENGYTFQNIMGTDFTKLDIDEDAIIVTCVGSLQGTLYWLGGYLSKINNGFKVYNFYEERQNGDFQYIKKTFTYTAIKYT